MQRRQIRNRVLSSRTLFQRNAPTRKGHGGIPSYSFAQQDSWTDLSVRLYTTFCIPRGHCSVHNNINLRLFSRVQPPAQKRSLVFFFFFFLFGYIIRRNFRIHWMPPRRNRFFFLLQKTFLCFLLAPNVFIGATTIVGEYEARSKINKTDYFHCTLFLPFFLFLLYYATVLFYFGTSAQHPSIVIRQRRRQFFFPQLSGTAPECFGFGWIAFGSLSLSLFLLKNIRAFGRYQRDGNYVVLRSSGFRILEKKKGKKITRTDGVSGERG